MKKRDDKLIVFSLYLFSLILMASLVAAPSDEAQNEGSGSNTNTQNIESNSLATASENVPEVSQDIPNKAYRCLENKTEEAGRLSFEQAIYAGLALGRGKDDKIINTIKESKSSSEACWPAGGCKLKETAQVALYYNRIGENTEEIVKWLKTKSATATGLRWYLEIDILDHTSSECIVGYDEVRKTIQIQEDMRIGQGAASACFAPSSLGYWLQIADRCVEKNFEISCNKDFLTTLLYEKSQGGTIYVSPETHNAAQGAITKEQVQARCFKTGGECDYEGTLWAILALHKIGGDVSSYIPYAQALEENNLKYFPSAFIYFVQESQEQYTNIIEQRKPGKFWEIIGSPYKRYYDTSLALLALDRSSSVRTEAEQAKNYLASAQLKDGCWNARDSIIDTGFILYSAWPKAISSARVEPGTTALCSQLPGAACETNREACLQAGGREQSAYICLKAREFCCSVKVPAKTCSDQQGTLCKANEECLASVLDSSNSGICCSEQCAPKQEINTCPSTASCKSACGDDEEEVAGAICGTGGVCCTEKIRSKGGSNYAWIIILVILILLVVLAIIYRNKLRMAWHSWKGKIKSTPVTKPGSSGRAAPAQSFGPRPPFSPGMARPPIRPVVRPVARQQAQNAGASKDKELEETMKKLREMTK